MVIILPCTRDYGTITNIKPREIYKYMTIKGKVEQTNCLRIHIIVMHACNRLTEEKNHSQLHLLPYMLI